MQESQPPLVEVIVSWGNEPLAYCKATGVRCQLAFGLPERSPREESERRPRIHSVAGRQN